MAISHLSCEERRERPEWGVSPKSTDDDSSESEDESQ
jgi:hypothetical protein